MECIKQTSLRIRTLNDEEKSTSKIEKDTPISETCNQNYGQIEENKVFGFDF